MDKVDSMQEQMGHINRELGILWKNKTWLLVIKKKKNLNRNDECFWWIPYRLSTAEERSFEPEDLAVETSKPKEQTEQKLKE